MTLKENGLVWAMTMTMMLGWPALAGAQEVRKPVPPQLMKFGDRGVAGPEVATAEALGAEPDISVTRKLVEICGQP